jgi:PAS domain-containing protein
MQRRALAGRAERARPAPAQRAPVEDNIRALEADERYAVVRYDADFCVTGWSRGAMLLFGWTAAEALGRTETDLINLAATAQEQAKLDDLRRRVRETGDVQHTDVWYAKHGRAVLAEAHIFATGSGFVGVMTGRQLQLDAGHRRKMRQINLRLPEEVIAVIEDLRADMPRERFLRMVITAYLEAAQRGETPRW